MIAFAEPAFEKEKKRVRAGFPHPPEMVDSKMFSGLLVHSGNQPSTLIIRDKNLLGTPWDAEIFKKRYFYR